MAWKRTKSQKQRSSSVSYFLLKMPIFVFLSVCVWFCPPSHREPLPSSWATSVKLYAHIHKKYIQLHFLGIQRSSG